MTLTNGYEKENSIEFSCILVRDAVGERQKVIGAHRTFAWLFICSLFCAIFYSCKNVIVGWHDEKAAWIERVTAMYIVRYSQMVYSALLLSFVMFGLHQKYSIYIVECQATHISAFSIRSLAHWFFHTPLNAKTNKDMKYHKVNGGRTHEIK